MSKQHGKRNQAVHMNNSTKREAGDNSARPAPNITLSNYLNGVPDQNQEVLNVGQPRPVCPLKPWLTFFGQAADSSDIVL
jgi:hypothetical protein